MTALSGFVFDEVRPTAYQRSFPPGHVLFRQGDILSRLYQVSSGWIKLSRNTFRGQDLIVELLFPGDYFELSCLLDGGPTSLTASTLNLHPAELNCQSQTRLGDPRMMAVIQQQLASRMREQQEMMAALATGRVEQKLLLVLQRVARRAGRRVGEQVLVPMPLTRQELGDWTGASAESSIRALSELQRRGLITLEGRDVLCRPDLLEDSTLEGAACFATCLA